MHSRQVIVRPLPLDIFPVPLKFQRERDPALIKERALNAIGARKVRGAAA